MWVRSTYPHAGGSRQSPERLPPFITGFSAVRHGQGWAPGGARVVYRLHAGVHVLCDRYSSCTAVSIVYDYYMWVHHPRRAACASRSVCCPVGSAYYISILFPSRRSTVYTAILTGLYTWTRFSHRRGVISPAFAGSLPGLTPVPCLFLPYRSRNVTKVEFVYRFLEPRSY